ncbi:MAG: RluA family pseudouridine synthase [Candidatus Omnitrophota bacterium]
MKTFNFKVSQEDAGFRLDAFLAKELSPEISRSSIKKLIAKRCVLVNSKNSKPASRLKFDDLISVNIDEEEATSLVKADIALNIIYEDEDILAIDKPSGLSVHPGAGNKINTVANALIAYTDKLSKIDPNRPGIVHRLDKDTSGIMVIARNNEAHYNLTTQFKNHSIKKTYLAVVEGQVQFDEGFIDAPIETDARNRQRMKVNFASNRPARTEYKVLKRFQNFSVLELSPITGRTHQLRVHMKYLGHPIVGDKKYSSRVKFNRLCLHAKSIRLQHPKTNEVIELEAKIPEEISVFIKGLEKK